MVDYLNIMISEPDLFLQMLYNLPHHENVKQLNMRRYDALDGTLLHLAVMGLLEPTNNVAFDDDIALKLVSGMIDHGACTLIESSERRIPYELFELFDVNPIDFKTYRYLLTKTTSNLLDGSCKREFYEDYLDGNDNI